MNTGKILGALILLFALVFTLTAVFSDDVVCVDDKMEHLVYAYSREHHEHEEEEHHHEEEEHHGHDHHDHSHGNDFIFGLGGLTAGLTAGYNLRRLGEPKK